MRISGPVRMVVGFFIAIALGIALLKWHQHRNLISRPTPSAGLSSTPHLGGSALPELTSSRPKKDDSSLPPESGHTYHAYELLYHPDRDSGNLIELDPFSVPVLNPTVPDFVTYIKLRPRDAVVAGMVGLRYANDISSNVSVFDVRAEDTAGDFMQGTDIITVGQIAVQISGPNRTPNPLRVWDVEPKGTIEGRSAAGLVVRIPLIRFWRYHDTHLDEPEPKVITIPPQIEANAARTMPIETESSSEADRRKRADEEFANEYQAMTNFETTIHDNGLRTSIESFVGDLDLLRQAPHDHLNAAITNGEVYQKHWVIDDRVAGTEQSLRDLEALLTGRSPSLALGAENYLKTYEDFIQANQRTVRSLYAGYRTKIDRQSAYCAPIQQVNSKMSGLDTQLTLASQPNRGTTERLVDLTHASMLQSDLRILLPCYHEGS